MQPETIFGIHPLKLNRGWHFGAGRCTTQRIWFIKPLQLPGNFRNSKLETDFGVPRPKPGGVVLRQRIAPLGLTITDAAATRRVRRTTLSELVNGKARDFPRNGREAVEGLRRQRRKLAHAAGALRAGARQRRPHQAQAVRIRVKADIRFEFPISSFEFRKSPPKQTWLGRGLRIGWGIRKMPRTEPA